MNVVVWDNAAVNRETANTVPNFLSRRPVSDGSGIERYTRMARTHRLLVLLALVLVANPASACEPVVPFMQVMVPALALSGSTLILALAVLLKSVLFAVFERRLPRLDAAWRMFLGNVLTSFVGLLVAMMIASSPGILAHWGAIGLLSVLAAIPAARQGGSVSILVPNIASGPRGTVDGHFAGKLHSVHGCPRGRFWLTNSCSTGSSSSWQFFSL